jgi:hypothetical protein
MVAIQRWPWYPDGMEPRPTKGMDDRPVSHVKGEGDGPNPHGGI